ncbi:MAG: UDP-N-acetylglucosamine 2-epimerase [Brevundimonas sp.]|jgi:UDP-hydrolysing UDP-N-acetyl-D-glucosamine 2-epimerase|uniref:UDP-N-acetylglucosamine 2-epimerase n=1 Tax=Brevundimonas sp. TaxID=1871086 RepID=UPI0025C542BE|nr:UDP-N-acetylglucosamine 2-epimerase [Brevundimonas sp.]MCH4269937.1 UDP-N-acetylglucosamine 2-epimerase [Brevundimonas sp.]
MSKARIGVFTATRAEYGLLYPILSALRQSERLEAVLIVSGTHLSPDHGMTVAEIENDGQAIAARIPIQQSDDDALSVGLAMAAALKGCVEAFSTLNLDAVLLLGDRTELLGAAAAATALQLPILHIEGGHVTEGAVDDAVRHAITKLAALHFTAAEPYRQRIIQMGEDPERVFTVGSTGLDNLMAEGVRSIAEIGAEIGLDLSPAFLLVTFHPETLGAQAPEDQMAALRQALDDLPDFKVLYTLPNADEGNKAIRRAIADHVSAAPGRVFAVESLGRRRYAWALSAAAAVVGNSSSGVIEAPAHRVATVNIGDRQQGRLRAASVLDVPAEAAAIGQAIRRGVSPEFRCLIRDQINPMGDGAAGRRIVEILEGVSFESLRRKRFRDL